MCREYENKKKQSMKQESILLQLADLLFHENIITPEEKVKVMIAIGKGE